MPTRPIPRRSPISRTKDARLREMIHDVLSRSPGLPTGNLSRRIYRHLCEHRDYRQSLESVGFDVARLLREEELEGTVARIDGAWWPGGEQ